MADLAIVNGNLITLDQGQPAAEAALVRHGRIARVGTTADVLAAAGDAQVYDAGGRTIVRMNSVFQSVEDRDGMVQSGMESGVREGFERLDEVLEKLVANR